MKSRNAINRKIHEQFIAKELVRRNGNAFCCLLRMPT
ncbi:hypothetical protein T4B_1336 [Trichinella pseudospiralis]|uniref:Uncharacterized protein n=1 Tax=Trichinella pseudospiralis TaxID=6337 RepID=A0A0V1GBJ4_TRIPS|nr:hypothetical protein T4B_1336 [Trichinella pseudospiralis]KRY98727.1 hypothetical protein T4C_8375 [Trichinella pseudospiralis]